TREVYRGTPTEDRSTSSYISSSARKYNIRMLILLSLYVAYEPFFTEDDAATMRNRSVILCGGRLLNTF
ncbi:MAG: hypothetical protein AAB891_00585, partial [Patescibacteria group bacterium]